VNANLLPLYDLTALTPAHKELLASLPFDDLIFRKLFDFIDETLGSYRCNNNFDWTIHFLKGQNVDFSKHAAFFTSHKITCDCEVISLLESKFPVDLNEFNRRRP
jgi:hypothetical protein